MRLQRPECAGGLAQDEMTHMVRRPRGRRLWTAAALAVLMRNRPVGCPEQREFQGRDLCHVIPLEERLSK